MALIRLLCALHLTQNYKCIMTRSERREDIYKRFLRLFLCELVIPRTHFFANRGSLYRSVTAFEKRKIRPRIALNPIRFLRRAMIYARFR